MVWIVRKVARHSPVNVDCTMARCKMHDSRWRALTKGTSGMNAAFLTCGPQEATPQEKSKFVGLVNSREAVAERFVRAGIERQGAKMVFAFFGEKLVGVSALKMPLNSYRMSIGGAAKSGFRLPLNRFPFELGYVAVAAAYERKGLGRQLVAQAVALSGGSGLFATTSNPAMFEKILPQFGFYAVGKAWASDRKPESGKAAELHLLVRDPVVKSA